MLLYKGSTIKEFYKFCFEAHKHQVDKSGLPYVHHPFHLAEQMEDEAATVVALLHDVVEDTPRMVEALAKLGFSGEVLQALRLLTHDPAVPYMDYIMKIQENPLARKVKLADLHHNSDLSRLDYVDGRALQRVEKYRQAIALLEG